MIGTELLAAGLVTVSIWLALLAIGSLVRGVQAREQLVTHAEDVAAPPDVLSDPLRRSSFIVRWADRYDRAPRREADRERLRKAYLSWRPSTYRLGRLGLALAMIVFSAIIMKLPLPLTAILTLVTYFLIPRFFLRSRHDAFLRAFNNQMVEINQTLANGLRAGMSIQQALGHLVETIDEPAKSEFRKTYNEIMLGDDLVKVLLNLGERVGSRDLYVVLDAIIVQHQAGGNLARILHGLADTVTQRQQLTKEINAMTAERRYGSILVPIIPVLTLLLLRNSIIGQVIFDSPLGWAILAVYAVLQIGVFLIIRRAGQFEI